MTYYNFRGSCDCGAEWPMTSVWHCRACGEPYVAPERGTRCPGCGGEPALERFNPAHPVPPDYTGKRYACPACGTKRATVEVDMVFSPAQPNFDLPHMGTGAMGQHGTAPPPDGARRQRWVFVWLIAAFLVLFALGAVVGWLLTSSAG